MDSPKKNIIIDQPIDTKNSNMDNNIDEYISDCDFLINNKPTKLMNLKLL